MAILNFKMDFAGQANVHPRIGRLQSTDALATVAGAGYVNPIIAAQSIALVASDIIAVSASDGNEFYRPSIDANTGIVTLTLIS